MNLNFIGTHTGTHRHKDTKTHTQTHTQTHRHTHTHTHTYITQLHLMLRAGHLKTLVSITFNYKTSFSENVPLKYLVKLTDLNCIFPGKCMVSNLRLQPTKIVKHIIF